MKLAPPFRPSPPTDQNQPLKALLQAALPDLSVVEGQIWRIPSKELRFRSNREFRWCVVVRIERHSDGTPIQVHLVVGSTRPDDGPVPELLVEAGEGDLRSDTFFAFGQSSPISLEVLLATGELKGVLAERRLAELDEAIEESTLVNLKRIPRR
jgi:hypothetical protein